MSSKAASYQEESVSDPVEYSWADDEGAQLDVENSNEQQKSVQEGNAVYQEEDEQQNVTNAPDDDAAYDDENFDDNGTNQNEDENVSQAEEGAILSTEKTNEGEFEEEAVDDGNQPDEMYEMDNSATEDADGGLSTPVGVEQPASQQEAPEQEEEYGNEQFAESAAVSESKEPVSQQETAEQDEEYGDEKFDEDAATSTSKDPANQEEYTEQDEPFKEEVYEDNTGADEDNELDGQQAAAEQDKAYEQEEFEDNAAAESTTESSEKEAVQPVEEQTQGEPSSSKRLEGSIDVPADNVPASSPQLEAAIEPANIASGSRAPSHIESSPAENRTGTVERSNSAPSTVTKQASKNQFSSEKVQVKETMEQEASSESVEKTGTPSKQVSEVAPENDVNRFDLQVLYERSPGSAGRGPVSPLQDEAVKQILADARNGGSSFRSRNQTTPEQFIAEVKRQPWYAAAQSASERSSYPPPKQSGQVDHQRSQIGKMTESPKKTAPAYSMGQRRYSSPENLSPGPCAYTIADPEPRGEGTRRAFGTEPRFAIQTRTEQTFARVPGPGEYALTTFHKLSTKHTLPPVAFTSGDRIKFPTKGFEFEFYGCNSPGPIYKPKTPPHKICVAFGTQPRGVDPNVMSPQEKVAAGVPGPGEYKQDGVYPATSPKPSFGVSSRNAAAKVSLLKAQANSVLVGQTSMGPGGYNPNEDATSKHKGVAKTGFGFGVRFPPLKVHGPGPGQYVA